MSSLKKKSTPTVKKSYPAINTFEMEGFPDCCGIDVLCYFSGDDKIKEEYYVENEDEYVYHEDEYEITDKLKAYLEQERKTYLAKLDTDLSTYFEFGYKTWNGDVDWRTPTRAATMTLATLNPEQFWIAPMLEKHGFNKVNVFINENTGNELWHFCRIKK